MDFSSDCGTQRQGQSARGHILGWMHGKFSWHLWFKGNDILAESSSIFGQLSFLSVVADISETTLFYRLHERTDDHFNQPPN